MDELNLKLYLINKLTLSLDLFIYIKFNLKIHSCIYNGFLLILFNMI